MSRATATVGLPEIKLAYSRLHGMVIADGADNAIKPSLLATLPAEALKNHAVDAVVAPEKQMPPDPSRQRHSWRFRLGRPTGPKDRPLSLGMIGAMMCFTTAKGFIAGKAGKNYPAPLEAVKAGVAPRASTARVPSKRSKGLRQTAKTTVAESLTGLFLNDQLIKKKGKACGKIARPVNHGRAWRRSWVVASLPVRLEGHSIVMKDITTKR